MYTAISAHKTEKESLARTALYDAIGFRNTFTHAVMQFIQYHLDTISAEYWTAHFGTPIPSAEQILDRLDLDDRSFKNVHDLTANEITFNENHLDFILPADASTYALCVSFKNDQVYAISIAH